MTSLRSKYCVGDRVFVETFGGTLDPGKYVGIVESISLPPESRERGPFYQVKLDEGARVSCFESIITPSEERVTKR